MSIKLNDEY
jgi:hypothetical protein